ncbi:hypothetical protein Bca52824_039067 [Brassica carinata]|uniref:Uncharacterized protein n=1 Tax=Brassica carinata TaxID=52824 RepID=A0A8X7RSC7_BRACI|nr:hypothetical protein Bca52824_039067 [Brassica carinata]
MHQGLAKALGQMMGTFTMRLKCVPQYDPSRSFHADPRSYICYWKLYDYAYTHRSKLATPSMISFEVNKIRKQAEASTQSLGSVESNRSRYGNIGVLVLTVASAPIHPLSFVKSISSPPTRVTTLTLKRIRHIYHGYVRQLSPNVSTIMFVSVLNSPMEPEMKRVSTASPSRLPIFLPSGSVEIHLVSQGNIDGCRAVLFRVTGYISAAWKTLFLNFSSITTVGYFDFRVKNRESKPEKYYRSCTGTKSWSIDLKSFKNPVRDEK